MRSTGLGLTLLLLLSAISILAVQQGVPLDEVISDTNHQSGTSLTAATSARGSGTWELADAPQAAGGWTPMLWQPSPTGALWDLDWSPDGRFIAAIDIDDARLYVWNASDGRVLLWVKHPYSLVDVVWLDATHVLAADSLTNWYSYEVTDDGSGTPAATSATRSGSWTDNLSGSKPGYLWGLDVDVNQARIVFCGSIAEPTIGGELVVANVAHFIDGTAAGAVHAWTNKWLVDCSLSPNASEVVSIGRNSTSATTNRDIIYGHDAQTLQPLWGERNVGGIETTAWALDWSPDGQNYTVGYNRPTEGVISTYARSDGSVGWFSPIPQNISSLAWMPAGDIIAVGVHDPGRLLIIDNNGILLRDEGWHSYIWNNIGYSSDVLAVAADKQGQRVASAGRDGGIEIWDVDSQGGSLFRNMRLGTSLLRELSVHPLEPLVALAESSGVVSVRDTYSAGLRYQCFHPDYGILLNEIPFAKSVSWYQNDILVGFSDGTIVTCDSQGKDKWSFRLDQHRSPHAFGRVAMHPQGGQFAITWGENENDSTKDGRLSIVDVFTQTIVNQFNYTDGLWPLSWNRLGDKLSSASQTGEILLWDTSDPDPASWTQSTSPPMAHDNYTNVVVWNSEADALLSAGWDGRVKLWDAEQNMLVLNMSITGKAFAGAFLFEAGQIVIARTDGTNGQLDFIDAMNQTVVSSFPVVHIPRGLGVLPTSAGLVVGNHTGGWMVLKADSDGDGVLNLDDMFPTDPTQWWDTDADGFGDNSNSSSGDACPTVAGSSHFDRNGCPDSDSDGWSDTDASWPACTGGMNGGDLWPQNPSQWCDSDNDGYGDNYTWEYDAFGLRSNANGDAFPYDGTQWSDLDGDGCGDNHTFSGPGADGLRSNERGDAFTSDPAQCTDIDGDGYGDNYDYNVGQDGLRIETGDRWPLDSLAWADPDNDGCAPASATGLPLDLHPFDPTRCAEPLEYFLPLELTVDGMGSPDGDWQITVGWKAVQEHTVRVVLLGTGWNASAGMNESQTSALADNATALQEWTTFPQQPMLLSWEIPRAADEDRLTLRLIASPSVGEALDVWVNLSYIPPPIDDTSGGSDNGSGGGVVTDPPTKQTAKDGNQIPWLWVGVGVAAFVLVLLLAGVLLKRRSGAAGQSQIGPGVDAMFDGPAAQLPCPHCSQPAEETVHEGSRWTWCPNCRKWLDYLGVA